MMRSSTGDYECWIAGSPDPLLIARDLFRKFIGYSGHWHKVRDSLVDIPPYRKSELYRGQTIPVQIKDRQIVGVYQQGRLLEDKPKLTFINGKWQEVG